jgi:hypothetical protein
MKHWDKFAFHVYKCRTSAARLRPLPPCQALDWGLRAPASPPPPLTDRWAWPHGRFFRGAHVNAPTAAMPGSGLWAGAGAAMPMRPIFFVHAGRRYPVSSNSAALSINGVLT